MKPGSFDPATCRELVGDERARSIEAKARADADAGILQGPSSGGSYWDEVKHWAEYTTYLTQHKKRTERNARKAVNPAPPEGRAA